MPLQHPRNGRGRPLPHLAVGILQQVEGLDGGELAAVHGKAQARGGLVEQPHPGAACHQVLLAQDLLALVGEHVRAEGAKPPQPGAVAGEIRRSGEPRLQDGVVHAGELEGDEQQTVVDRRGPLAHPLEEAGDGGIVAGDGKAQLGEGADAPQRLQHLLVAAHQFREPVGGKLRHASAGALRQLRRTGLGAGEVRLDGRVLRTGVEIGEVPHRQRLGRLHHHGGTAAGGPRHHAHRDFSSSRGSAIRRPPHGRGRIGRRGDDGASRPRIQPAAVLRTRA
ncbi:hypothetical protein HRbin39_01930 [bacterium HR39]|nr:hypothetical protein HRbin39_01930 [bacterium HR39]